MLLLLSAIAWVLFVAILLWRSVRQYSYYQVLRPAPDSPYSDIPKVAVIVPARNEEQCLARCIESLLGQDYPPGRMNIFVLDDQSTDSTSAIAQDLAARDPRVRLMSAGTLPLGWTGKAHACHEGAAVAGESDWLCFIDADITSAPPLLKTALGEAIRRDIALLSLSPSVDLCSPWERLIVPAGFFLLAFTQDVRAMDDAANLDVHADGQFLLIRRAVYQSTGGFAAVGSSVSEDSALARAVKAAGHRVALLGTEQLMHARMYGDLRSLWEGLARQASELLGHTGQILAWCVGALVLGWVSVLLPILAIFEVVNSGPHPVAIAALVLAMLGSLSLLGTHIGAAKYFRIPPIYGLLFPLSYTLGAAILLTAAIERHRGLVIWKGRLYKPSTQGR
jgi:chlorobactene glucosyltransferase